MKPAVKGERLTIEKVLSEQRFTLPPSRYTEAGLVKALEEKDRQAFDIRRHNQHTLRQRVR